MIVNDSVNTILSTSKNFLNWSMEKEENSLRLAIPIMTFIVSEAFFNLSTQYSVLLASISLGVTIIEQKDPTVKIKICEKIKNVSIVLYDRYQEFQKEKNERLLKKEKKEAYENVKLMLSFLELGYDQISKDCETENSGFINSCQALGLTASEIRTMLNYYKLSPKSFKENENEYEERLEKFISLLPCDKRDPFQLKLDDFKKKQELSNLVNNSNSINLDDLFPADQILNVPLTFQKKLDDYNKKQELENSVDGSNSINLDNLFPSDQKQNVPLTLSFQQFDSSYSPRFSRDETIESFISNFLYELSFLAPIPVGHRSMDTLWSQGKAIALSRYQTKVYTSYVYYMIILNEYYQSEIRKIPGVTDEIAYLHMPFINKNYKSGIVSITFPSNDGGHSISLNHELKKAVKGIFCLEKKIVNREI